MMGAVLWSVYHRPAPLRARPATGQLIALTSPGLHASIFTLQTCVPEADPSGAGPVGVWFQTQIVALAARVLAGVPDWPSGCPLLQWCGLLGGIPRVSRERRWGAVGRTPAPCTRRAEGHWSEVYAGLRLESGWG
jgi:hypothetical protein